MGAHSMTSNANLEGVSPEDSEVIRGLREQLKTANKAVKTAGEDAIAKVKRGQTASSLMPEEFKGLSDIFETEVDGELTAESAAEWLKGRGFTASSDEADAEAAATAAALEEVTNLGGAVAAAGNLTPEDSKIAQLEALELDPGGTQNLADVTKIIEDILNG